MFYKIGNVSSKAVIYAVLAGSLLGPVMYGKVDQAGIDCLSQKAESAKSGKTVFDANSLAALIGKSNAEAFAGIYGLFKGAKNSGESMQFNHELEAFANQPRTVDISSIKGVTTSQIYWKNHIQEIDTDRLASYIPADQHAIFYPTFRSMMELLDEIEVNRQPLENFGFSADRLEFYQSQMCIWLDGWSRFWGPKTIRGVAVTGSDPYMADGTDSAVLFDASLTSMVYKNTESKQKKMLKQIKDARLIEGVINGIEYRGVVSPDRRVSSYLAKIDNVVVVTNSLVQMRKIVEAALKKVPLMSEQDEYKFFRDRYNTDENRQTALVVLTDAAIRRWCSPKWRIGAARRSIAAASMRAAQIDLGDSFDDAKAHSFLKSKVPDIGKVTFTDAGITSAVYGNPAFMTPIAELEIDRISEREAAEYESFREMYEKQWRNLVGPTAVCLLLDDDQITIDITTRSLMKLPAQIQTSVSNIWQADLALTVEDSGLRAVIKIERE